MRIQEAIKDLENSLAILWENYPQHRKEAVKLGIEALKWRQQMELDYGSWCGPLLPGETEE